MISLARKLGCALMFTFATSAQAQPVVIEYGSPRTMVYQAEKSKGGSLCISSHTKTNSVSPILLTDVTVQKSASGAISRTFRNHGLVSMVVCLNIPKSFRYELRATALEEDVVLNGGRRRCDIMEYLPELKLSCSFPRNDTRKAVPLGIQKFPTKY